MPATAYYPVAYSANQPVRTYQQIVAENEAILNPNGDRFYQQIQADQMRQEAQYRYDDLTNQLNNLEWQNSIIQDRLNGIYFTEGKTKKRGKR